MEQIALVDQSERFVFKPMLYELLSGGMQYYIYATTAVFSDSNMIKQTYIMAYRSGWMGNSSSLLGFAGQHWCAVFERQSKSFAALWSFGSGWIQRIYSWRNCPSWKWPSYRIRLVQIMHCLSPSGYPGINYVLYSA